MSKFINPFTDVCFMKVEDIVDIASMSKWEWMCRPLSKRPDLTRRSLISYKT